MGILMWDKPKKAMSTENWKEISFEDGPSGGYVPNIAEEDLDKWRAKLVGKTSASPQVEIRSSIGGAQLLIIVNLGGGYKYKSYVRKGEKLEGRWGGYETGGINVHMALNGGAQFTFDEFAQIQQAVTEAKEFLENL
jgi:hypothetical protein